jgi:calmodulin
MSANPAPEGPLSEEKRRELREAFDLFVSDQADASIPAANLGLIARSLNLSPTEAEIAAATARYGGPDARVTFEQFVDCFQGWAGTRLGYQEVVEAFQVFDRENTGYIHVEELKKLLTSMGEKLSVEEAEELLGDAHVDGRGMINYRDFAQQLMA